MRTMTIRIPSRSDSSRRSVGTRDPRVGLAAIPLFTFANSANTVVALAEGTQIAVSADEVWLCRVDLGAELGLKGMATAVSQFSDRVHAIPVPVLLAGQVLEHMAEHPTPTRTEVCGLHEALGHGYQGFVLSDETAIGQDPVESCRVAALFRS